jgi:hypothetical protein
MSQLDALLEAAAAAPIAPAVRERARRRLQAAPRRRRRAPRRRLLVAATVACVLVVGAVALSTTRGGTPSAYAAVERQLRGVGSFPLPGSGSLDTRHAHVLGVVKTGSGPAYIAVGFRVRSSKGVSTGVCAGLLGREPFSSSVPLPGGLYFGFSSCGESGGGLATGPFGHDAVFLGHVVDTTRTVSLVTPAGTMRLPLYDRYYGGALPYGTRPPVRVVERDAAGRVTETWTIDPALLAGKLPRRP